MLYPPTEKKVYLYFLQGSRYLFADERDKKHLLDLIGIIRRRDSWLLLAFTILDDSAYFIIETARISWVIHNLQHEIQHFGKLPKSEREMTGQIKKLDTLAEVAQCGRSIHRLPLERGYVCRLEDYWWSSYPSYVGIHTWELVEQRMLRFYFSADPETAARRLKRFHTQKGILPVAERMTENKGFS